MLFHQGDRGICVHYDAEDLEQDVQYLRDWAWLWLSLATHLPTVHIPPLWVLDPRFLLDKKPRLNSKDQRNRGSWRITNQIPGFCWFILEAIYQTVTINIELIRGNQAT